MRLILRAQKKQSELEGKSIWNDKADDYAVIVDGPVVGRIYKQVGSSLQSAQWRWIVQKGPYANGYAATLEDAQSEFAKAFKSES
jgi:hypothetical protein